MPNIAFLDGFALLTSIPIINNQVQRVYTVNFYIIRISNCDIPNVINISVFV